jgi:SAM-dependent methyltransferase
MEYSDSIDQRLTGRHRKSFQFVGDVGDKTVLDIGCSFGWFERWAIENNCTKIVGIEPDEEDFKIARDAIPDATFQKGSALNLPFESDFFDIVVLWEVLEHLPKNTEDKAFQEIYRILKPEGSLFLSTPHRTFWSCVLDPAWWLIGHRHYTSGNLNKMLKQSGFKVVKHEYGGGFYELFSMILLYIFKWLFRREIPFKNRFDKKRDSEFVDKEGFSTIFIEAIKSSKNHLSTIK